MEDRLVGDVEKESRQIQGLLLTVGGTPEPMIYAVKEIRPTAIVFVCSEETQQTVVEVKRRLEEALLEGGVPRYKTLIVENPANLVECYFRAAEGLSYLRDEIGLNREQIRIDFTGGTKAMSAAAVLAASPDGYRFSYVSGAERDKDGVGVVVSGSEELQLPDNPWTVLEEPEIRRVRESVAVGQWAAALDGCRRLIARSTSNRKPMFDSLKETIRGLAHWDRFDQEKAWKSWDEGRIPKALERLAEVAESYLLVALARKCIALCHVLGPLAQCIDNPPKTGNDRLVLDMLGNADRQFDRGHYDEAALRYYRALELLVQRRLAKPYKIDVGNVSKDAVPSPLKERLIERKGEPRTGWKLGQRDAIELLAAVGDTLGRRILDHYDKLDRTARNENWLIHGTRHVSQKAAAKFRAKLLDAMDIPEDAIPAWPDFRP